MSQGTILNAVNSFKIEAFNPRQTQTGSNPTTM